VFDLRNRLDYRELVSSEFYNDFFKPADIHYDLLTAVSGNGVRGALCLFRSRRGRPFSKEDAAVMELVAPFLGSHARRVIEADLDALAGATFEKAVIICDLAGRALYCNELGSDLIADLSRQRKDQRSHLGDQPRRGSRSSPIVGGPEGPILGSVLDADVLANNLDTEVVVQKVDLGHGVAARMVTAERRAGQKRSPTEGLRGRFGLSDREIEVLRLVIAGASNKEIAGRLFIAERTVKWHMQRIADKVGARSRTAIVHAVNEASQHSPG
jgi:DNA-binding CsgD family transcriptional regulator